MKECWSIEILNDLRLVAQARSWATRYLDQHAVNEKDQKEIRVIIGELCGNVVRHAGMAADDRYRLELRFYPQSLCIIVTDKGKGLKRESVPEPDGESEDGWGLKLVELLGDNVEYRDTKGIGTAIRVMKHYGSWDREQGRAA